MLPHSYAKRIVIIGLLLLTALACARAKSPVSTLPPSLPAGDMTRTLSHGLDRNYMLYVPTSVDWDVPVPLVFVFHGGAGNAESARRMSGFDAVADQNGFLVVYPNGTGRLSDERLLTWNAGTCCGYAQENNVDDVGFVRAIVTDLESLVSVDEKRIYATGISNGGMLAHRLACEAADVFAAVAPVAGTLNVSPCEPSEPISVIEFHGTGDQNVLYDGGFGTKSVARVDFASVRDSVEFWATFNVCDAQPQMEMFDDIRHETWAGCARGISVELYTIVDGGHTWPGGQSGWTGGDQPTETISASQLIWEFFTEHPKL